MVVAAAAVFAPVAAEAATFTVINTNIGGAGSLAQAIADANATSGSDEIHFNIPGGGVHTIGGTLPAVTEAVSINGYTQPGAATNTAPPGSTNAVLKIRLEGTQVPLSGAVLKVETGPTVIRGLNIGAIKSQTSGIEVGTGAADVTISGTFIGTSAAGDADSSSGTGILVRGSANIGGTFASERNLVSGNNTAGIQIAGSSTLVFGNLIGTNAAGQPVLGNGRGIRFAGSAAADNDVGDFGASSRNVIAGNSGEGIALAADAGDGNDVSENLFFENGGLAIDLGADGPTRNDEGDADSGPNDLLNKPEIAFARVNGDKLRVDTVLRFAPGSYQITYYASPESHDDGFGQGRTIVGGLSATVGSQPFRSTHEMTLGEVPADSIFVSAVATRIADGSASEFSREVEAVQAGTEIVVTTTSDSGPGSLRAALAEANSNPNTNTIVFDIDGPAPHVIAPFSPLLVDGGPTLIDGCSQPGSKFNTKLQGSDAVPGVFLDGIEQSAEEVVLAAVDAPVILRCLGVGNSPSTGIVLYRSSGSAVEGCVVGVDADAELDLGNGGSGIFVWESAGVRVGGPNVGQRNVIAGNTLAGILLQGFDTRVFNNVIGLPSLPNDITGIEAAGEGSLIGDDDPEFENVIQYNGLDGVRVETESSGNEIRGNRIHDNGGLGIDLFDGAVSGVAPNDAEDADTGANALQNFPVIQSVDVEPGLMTISGSLEVPEARKNSAYRLRVYSNAECDNHAFGEGEVFLGAIDVFIGTDETFGASLPITVSAGTVITTTVTDPETDNTSEFSACVSAQLANPVCGDASGDGKILSGDALAVLRAAVGTSMCLDCICDANGSGGILSSDAQLVLRKAVGQNVSLSCPACD